MTTEELAARELQDVRDSTLAIVSIVAAIAGWSFLPVVGGVIAIITGYQAKNEIRASGGRLRGDGLATAGIVISTACVAAAALLVMAVAAWAALFGAFGFVF